MSSWLSLKSGLRVHPADEILVLAALAARDLVQEGVVDLERVTQPVLEVGRDLGTLSVGQRPIYDNPRFEPLRRAYFTYHFDGLDHFVSDTQNARLAVLDVVSTMEVLYQGLSRQYTLDIFFSTKFQELTAIFQQSPLSAQAYGMLSEVDPSHLTYYNNLVQ